MFVLVSYDIPNDRRRTRVCNALKDYGDHVQYSVFECRLKEKDLERMETCLKKLISRQQDSVNLYFLCEMDVGKIRSLGMQRVSRDEAFYLV